jgi:4-hydroxy-2-oxoheptanedioate aldolase
MVIPDPAVASILGESGVDFVVIDAEHGAFTVSSLRSSIEALKNTPASAVVRTASQHSVEIQQLLDLGADGVLVPHVGSASEASSVVRASRYPPEGGRGIGAVRANRYGLDIDAYVQGANASVAVMVIIEDRRGVDHSAEIAAVPGLDGIVIGPSDLAADLGVWGKSANPTLQQAVDTVVASTLAAGLKVCSWSEARTPEEGDSMLVGCVTDAPALASAARSALEEARARSYSADSNRRSSPDHSDREQAGPS